MASGSNLRAVEIDFRTDPRWSDFVSAHRDALVYHHPIWLAALEREYGQKCICLACEDASGRLRAILPLFSVNRMPFKLGRTASSCRFSSLPRTPLGGPLALDKEAMTAMLRHAVEPVRSKPGLRRKIRVTPSLHFSCRWFAAAGARFR